MPTCANCSCLFRNRQVINGVPRNFQHRKRCIKCLPFRISSGGTPLQTGKVITCGLCSRRYVFDKRKGHQLLICNSCNANRKRRKRKQWAVAYKGGQCQRCGYYRCYRALHFHHRDPASKEFVVGLMMSMSLNQLKVEIDKCDLLCANCHMEIEAGLPDLAQVA